MLIGPAVVFLAFACLLVRLARSGSVCRFPAFTLSIVAWLLYLPAWAWVTTHQPGYGILPMLQPLLICARFLAWLEAWHLSTIELPPSERRWILGVLGIAVALGITYAWGLQATPYHAIRTYANLALAIAGIVTAAWVWCSEAAINREVRDHSLILTLYFAGHALANISTIAGMPWQATSALYCYLSVACAVLWWLRLKTKARFEYQLDIRKLPVARALPFVS